MMRPTDKATADSRSVQSFAIIKNTGHENFVTGRFHARARNELFLGVKMTTKFGVKLGVKVTP